MHHAFGLGLLVYLVAFAFGERTAQIVVGIVLVAGVLFFGAIVIFVVGGWA